MRGLYTKVLKGIYPSLPARYSNDLSTMIKIMLQVDPSKRPTTEDLLKLPLLRKRNIENSDEVMESEHLLGTIKLPRNLKQLTDRLPKSQYEEVKRPHS